MKRLLYTSFLAITSVVGSHATVLIFDDEQSGTLTPAALDTYGDNVTATTQGGANYGSAFGWTPDVVVDYTSLPTATTGVSTWWTGYGDLVNVIWGSGPQTGENTGIVTLTGTATQQVQLHELDVASWGAGAPDAFLRVYDSANTLVYENLGPFDEVNHDHITFSNVISEQIRIEFSQGWWTGLDNIGFSQTNPIPEPMTMIGVATLALLARRRRQR